MFRVLRPQCIFSITVLNLENSPAWVNEICERVAPRLVSVDGIRAVALGGSRARGTAREDSDIDLALYYDPTAPFALDRLDLAARELDDRHICGLVTSPGAWGPAVNGGGWLSIRGHRVDFLYRDLSCVRDLVERCVRGEIGAVYQLGHPIGFQNQIYAGETHICRPIYDPALELSVLKGLVETYPMRMRRALIDKHLFDARFEIEIAMGPAARGDLVYVSQCLTRATGFMVLVLHALNECFFLNEKECVRGERAIRTVTKLLPSHGRCTNPWINRPFLSTNLACSADAMRAVAADLQRFCAEKYPTAPM